MTATSTKAIVAVARREMTMSNRYVVAGLWFFGIAIGLGIALVLLGPVSGIRVLGLIGLVSAMAGFVLHLNELRDTDPRAYAALGRRLERIARRIERPMRNFAHGREREGVSRCGSVPPAPA
jgi:hypothetical protein